MHLKAALLATLAAGSFFLTACGGGSDSGDGGSSPGSQPQQSPPASEPQPSPPASEPQQLPPAACQPQTIVGGALFVAEQAPVGVTLLSNGGLTHYDFDFVYDNVFGIPTISNRQDKWGRALPLLFPPGTPIGTSTQVQFEPYPFTEQTPSTFPKGIPLELSLSIFDGNQPGPTNQSTTALLNKDIRVHDGPATASVTYGANNTATVTFFASTGGPAFSVSLTNVLGPAGSGGGC